MHLWGCSICCHREVEWRSLILFPERFSYSESGQDGLPALVHYVKQRIIHIRHRVTYCKKEIRKGIAKKLLL